MKIKEFMLLPEAEKERYNLHIYDNDFDIKVFHSHEGMACDFNCGIKTPLIGTGDTREPKFCFNHYVEINKDAEFVKIPEGAKVNHLVTFRFTSGEYSQIFYKIFNTTPQRLNEEVREYQRTYYGEPEESDADENCGNGWCYHGCQVALSHDYTEVITSYEQLLKELTVESATINKEVV